MSKISIFGVLVIIVMLTACSVTSEFPTKSENSTIQIGTISPTITHVYPTQSSKKATANSNITLSIVSITATSKTDPISTPYISPINITPTPTVNPPIANIVKNQCRDILPIIPASAHQQGVLVLSSPDGLSLVDYIGIVQRTIPGLLDYPSTSPDGKWLAYTSISPLDQTEMLFVESADGLIKRQSSIGPGWLTFNKGFWLNNNRLWFSVYPSIGQIAPLVVVNPFTGEQQEFQSDYPNVKGYQIGSSTGAGLHFGYHSVVPDSSLSLFIYPEFLVEEGYFISLWDKKSQSVLARLLDGGSYGHLPIWLQDGSKYVVVAQSKSGAPKEWFIVSRDGQKINRLTHFGDQFTSFEIQNNASVSPNGRYLTFGLSIPKAGSDVLDIGNLVIIDLEKSEVFNTCIHIDDGSIPIWSIDSRNVVFREPRADEKTASRVIMLDMEKGWAAQITENMTPVGWMVSP